MGLVGARRGGVALQRLRTWLAVDDAQAARVKTVMVSHKESLMQARDSAKAAREALVEGIRTSGGDEAAVRLAWRAFASEIEDSVVAAAGCVADVQAELTPEQQERCGQAMEHLRALQAAKLDMWREIGQPLSQGE
jgi:Spy/CpxP family protein refolding chaperone